MMMRTCTRRLSFDYGHRLLNHEAKCAHVHGHRGDVEVTVGNETLDQAGRVIDFACIKEIIGRRIDDELDHAFLVNPEDMLMRRFLRVHGQRHFIMPPALAEPSAENIAQLIFDWSVEMLVKTGKVQQVTQVRFYETPNNYADVAPIVSGIGTL